jgi:site-specific DNA-adenine methylase
MSIFGTYYGSKFRIINKYPKPNNNIKRIVEPFCGGGAYILRYPEYETIGIEKDIDVYSAYLTLQSMSEQDIRELEYIKGEDIRGHQYYPLMRQLAGVPPHTKVTSYGFDRKEQRKRTIIKHLDTIKKTKFIHGDAMDYFNRYDDVDTLWFIDPPYMGKGGKNYKEGNSNIDFLELAEQIKKLKGQVIVCGYLDDEYLPFVKLCDQLTMGKRKYSEGIWIN